MKQDICENKSSLNIFRTAHRKSILHKYMTPEEIIRQRELDAEVPFEGISQDKETVAAVVKEAPAPLIAQVGFKAIDLLLLPSKGMFYPKNSEIAIRAAQNSEIRHYSTMDEQDPYDINDKIGIVVEKSTKIRFGNVGASWKDLSTEDRMFLFFSIRDLTFPEPENKIVMSLGCNRSCLGTPGSWTEKVEITNREFNFYDLPDNLMKWYSEEERCLVFEHPVLGGTFKLYAPTLGVTKALNDFTKKLFQENKAIDKSFYEVAPYIIKDWRGLDDNAIMHAHQENLKWGSDKIATVQKLTEVFKFGMKTDLSRKCGKCGVEVSAPITFPGGFKSVFVVSSAIGDLLGE